VLFLGFYINYRLLTHHYIIFDVQNQFEISDLQTSGANYKGVMSHSQGLNFWKELVGS